MDEWVDEVDTVKNRCGDLGLGWLCGAGEGGKGGML